MYNQTIRQQDNHLVDSKPVLWGCRPGSWYQSQPCLSGATAWQWRWVYSEHCVRWTSPVYVTHKNTESKLCFQITSCERAERLEELWLWWLPTGAAVGSQTYWDSGAFNQFKFFFLKWYLRWRVSVVKVAGPVRNTGVCYLNLVPVLTGFQNPSGINEQDTL